MYAGIKSSIESGEFPQGLKLPTEHALCERFGVSRPVIRAVMDRLRQEGVIETVRGSGSFVIDGVEPAPAKQEGSMVAYQVSDIGDIMECQETRLVFEAEMAALAAERWNEGDMKRMETALNEIIKEHNRGGDIVNADYLFHRSIIQAAKNAYALLVFDSMKEQILLGMSMSRGIYNVLPEYATRHGLQEHVDMLDAIRDRDPGEARNIMRHHIGFFGEKVHHTRV
ncbi:FadR/GntR family transcriptional regulator [Pseudovibrio sp. SPO723]|uniref:FadR/GntR family transcriptional regulator n=1 Tax=Nesiotobacter zosterae TaxID=392721 RepID=UPI0029C2CFC2|nr:FadR/GntR family transcriptional regulator [Pseudovibrio sp. SPO723]MDX5595531.1 FadR/GntR family transcriptional regulator [Pseudovibrio sp. SPO723]